MKLELDDPIAFDEVCNRRKWSHVNKNTSKALKDQGVLNNNYWQLLNHVSAKGVKNIVTPSVLMMDKRSCDSLLRGILKEKIMDDERKNLIQRERQILRNKLALKHN